MINSCTFHSYRALAKACFQHEAKEFDPVEGPNHLQWLNTVISNVKAFISGTFHGLAPKHLQSYLKEFTTVLMEKIKFGEGGTPLLQGFIVQSAVFKTGVYPL
jgi:hypothetical protein